MSCCSQVMSHLMLSLSWQSAQEEGWALVLLPLLRTDTCSASSHLVFHCHCCSNVEHKKTKHSVRCILLSMGRCSLSIMKSCPFLEETPGCSEVSGVSGKSMGTGCSLKALISLSCTGCEHGMEEHPSC